MVRRVRRVRRRVGKGIFSDLLGGIGLGKRRVRRRRRKIGGSIFGDLWSGIKNVGEHLAAPVAGLVAKRFLGGRKRRRVRRKKGGSIAGHSLAMPWWKRAISHGANAVRALHENAKKRRVYSSALKDLGFKKLGEYAHSKGYGRRKRKVGGAMLYKRMMAGSGAMQLAY